MKSEKETFINYFKNHTELLFDNWHLNEIQRVYEKYTGTKANGKDFTLYWDGEKIADTVEVEINPDDIDQPIIETDNDYDYLFTIADLILELKLDEQAKKEIPKWAWTNIINCMIEFKKAVDYE